MGPTQSRLKFTICTASFKLERMKAYVTTTGVLFALLVLAHVMRVAQVGWEQMKDPIFLLSTAIAVGMTLWAWRLVLRLRRGGPAA